MKMTGADRPELSHEVGAGQRVRILFADQLNMARGKYISAEDAHKGHARLCVGTYAVTYARQMVPAPGGHMLEGLPDMEARFDPASLRSCWDGRSQVALADLFFHGEPFGLCGRSTLRKAIADWRALGFEPMVGVETEAYIFEPGADGKWIPYDTPGAGVYGTGPFCDPAGLIDEIWDMAARHDLPVESINAEFDPPQFELTLKFADALKAADDIFLFRQMAREILYKKGYLLSFLPKPIAGLSGSGLHINLSLRDGQGRNVFGERGSDGALPDIMQRCIAGMLHHHEALAGLLAPTVNSYDRLRPGSLSGYWANWGRDHRGVTVRVSGEEGAAARIEHRMGDCAASPYIAIAALLQAARLGLEHGYALSAEETLDAIENVGTDRHTPNDLGASLDALELDGVLSCAISQDLIDNFIAIKRAELEELHGKSAAEVFDYYAPFI